MTTLRIRCPGCGGELTITVESGWETPSVFSCPDADIPGVEFGELKGGENNE